MDDNSTRQQYGGGNEDNIAYVESGTTATRGYSIGDYVIIGGNLYRVIAQINSGGTFTVGTNIETTKVGLELKNLTDGIGGTTDQFRFGTNNGVYGYIKKVGGADTFVPFKNPTGNKSITISSTGTTSGIDVADYATASVTTSGLMVTPTATKAITANGNNQDVLNYAKVNVAVPNVVGSGSHVYQYIEQNETGSKTYTYIASSEGTYLAVGWSYCTNTENTSINATVTISSTGT